MRPALATAELSETGDQAAQGVARDVNRPFPLANRDRARREATGVHPEDAQTEPVAEAPRRSGST